jgi:hypothetical protein
MYIHYFSSHNNINIVNVHILLFSPLNDNSDLLMELSLLSLLLLILLYKLLWFICCFFLLARTHFVISLWAVKFTRKSIRNEFNYLEELKCVYICVQFVLHKAIVWHRLHFCDC